ncbi:MAG: SDR family NAD(P)-dependent oxidoreductase, partial [Gammaproteobacteria bacterium]|nr:SDR family NAD(P)-dependent oxidoreductase [Gammaproteobacteria bacterium]
ILLQVASERTGYPREMLGPDQDLEAELGIDSIKRVEIVVGLRERLSEELNIRIAERTGAFTRIRTLNGLVEAVEKELDAASSDEDSAKKKTSLTVSPSDEEQTPPADENPATDRHGSSQRASSLYAGGGEEFAVPLDRYVMRAVETPLQENVTPPLSEGLFLITEDERSVAGALRDRLKTAGIACGIIERTALDSPEHLARTVDSLREQYGRVTGIIHLAGFSDAPMPEALAPWRKITETEATSLFHLARLCGADLQESQGFIMGASMLGGYFGRDGHCGPGFPSSGAGSGLLKTLALEWPMLRVRVIDFDEQSREVIADRLFRELAARDSGEQEIGYCNDARFRFEGMEAPLSSRDESHLTPNSDWVVLALGGARGITAEILDELLLSGMTLILIGRTPEPDSEESDTTKDISEIAALRELFIEDSRRQGLSPTPREIEKRIGQLQRERAIRQNLARFRDAGAKVEYHAVDVRDAGHFGTILAEIYERHGRIDAVIQGAGIIEDKLLVDKTDASFHRVFDTKVDSTFILYRRLRPETLKMVILFSSVAGRTGNRGQADYAAANEVLNRLAWCMHEAWPNTRVLSINWGPWEVAGMASAEVNRQFRARGVIPIPIGAGRRFIRDEIRYGQPGEVELIAGIFSAPDDEPAGNRLESSVEGRGDAITVPLIQSQPRIQEDGSAILEHTFSLRRSPYLGDHRVDGKLVVPAAVAMELLAEFVQIAWPSRIVTEVRSLRVLQGITLDENTEREVLLRARENKTADSLQVDTEIVEPGTKRVLYHATVILESGYSIPPVNQWPPLISSEHDSAPVPAIADAYRKYCFHGPILQALTGIDGVSAEGIDTRVQSSSPTRWVGNAPTGASWLFDPGLVDGALQSFLIWYQINFGGIALPSRLGRVVRFGQSNCTPCHLALRLKYVSEYKFIADIGIFRDSHSLHLLLEDIEVYVRAKP